MPFKLQKNYICIEYIMQNNIIAVVGAKGKMGSVVCKKLQKNYEIVEIDIDFPINNAKNADLIIDFASAKSSVLSAKFCAENKIPLIIGSTGQTEKQKKTIEKYSKITPILICKNFSVGVFLQKKISELILNIIEPSITIFEKHHAEKKDSPSGTAIELKGFIEERFNGKVSVLSERGGKEVGTHKIDFYFGDELISVSHSAFSRDSFACGVVLAAEYMLRQSSPKNFNFMDILSSYAESLT